MAKKKVAGPTYHRTESGAFHHLSCHICGKTTRGTQDSAEDRLESHYKKEHPRSHVANHAIVPAKKGTMANPYKVKSPAERRAVMKRRGGVKAIRGK